MPFIVIHLNSFQGNAGYLKYQDTSTGQLLVEHRTKFGACNTMAQNKHNAVIYLGHQNGTLTLWTPNLPHPAVQLLAHLGPVVGVGIDQSTGGRYMSTAGRDGTIKVWDCRNWKGAVREWSARGGGGEVEWSAKGSLAVASGGSVNVRVMFTTVTNRTNYIFFEILSSGLYGAHNPSTVYIKISSSSVYHPRYPTPPAYLLTVLPIPRCINNWPLGWLVEHSCSWIRRTKLR